MNGSPFSDSFWACSEYANPQKININPNWLISLPGRINTTFLVFIYIGTLSEKKLLQNLIRLFSEKDF